MLFRLIAFVCARFREEHKKRSTSHANRESTEKNITKREDENILRRSNTDMASSSFHFNFSLCFQFYNIFIARTLKNLDWDFKNFNCVESGLCYNQMQSFSHSPQKPFTSSLPALFIIFILLLRESRIKYKKEKKVR